MAVGLRPKIVAIQCCWFATEDCGYSLLLVCDRRLCLLLGPSELAGDFLLLQISSGVADISGVSRCRKTLFLSSHRLCLFTVLNHDFFICRDFMTN